MVETGRVRNSECLPAIPSPHVDLVVLIGWSLLVLGELAPASGDLASQDTHTSSAAEVRHCEEVAEKLVEYMWASHELTVGWASDWEDSMRDGHRVAHSLVEAAHFVGNQTVNHNPARRAWAI